MKSRQGFSLKAMRGSITAFALMAALGLSACASPSLDETPPLASPRTPVEREKLPRFAQTGIASWYKETRKLARTANGEIMGVDRMTAAHRTLPMDTIVRVTNLNNGLSVLVRINDRGPFVGGRVIDLAHDAAQRIGMKDDGIAPVRLEVYESDQHAPRGERTASK